MQNGINYEKLKHRLPFVKKADGAFALKSDTVLCRKDG